MSHYGTVVKRRPQFRPDPVGASLAGGVATQPTSPDEHATNFGIVIQALGETSHKNEVFWNNGVHLHLRNGLLPQFQALTVFAGLACVLQFAIVGQIAIGQGALQALFKIQSGSWAATDAYAPISPEDTDAKGFEV